MSAAQPMMAACPKCKCDMIYVTAVPHPKGYQMVQTTFVCYPCNRTWNYALSPEMAASYATNGSDLATVGIEATSA